MFPPVSFAPPASFSASSNAPTPRVTGKRRAEDVDCLDRHEHGAKRPRGNCGASVAQTLAPSLPAPRNEAHGVVQHEFARAVVAGDTEGVQRALLAGADVNGPLADGQPPALYHVAERPQLAELLGTLMAAGPNVQAPAGQVGPLFLAVSAGNNLGVRVLLEAGADPLHVSQGLTPWLVAASLSDTSAARMQLYHAFVRYVGAQAAT